MSYRKCQWCDKDIYSDLDWFTIVTVTGLAFYFCCGDCAFEWLQRIKKPRMEIERQILDFNTYQKKAHETAQYNGVDSVENYDDIEYHFDLIDEMGYRVWASVYPFLKIHQEASEISEPIIKRKYRGDSKEIMKEHLELELGDTLWYVSECCTQLGISLEVLANANLNKLANRAKNNTIKGSGDNR